MRKPLISRDVTNAVMNPPSESLQLPVKRRLGRTSRSAMKPKTHYPKTRKNKKTSSPPGPNTDVVAEEEALTMESNGVEGELGARDYYGDCCNNLMGFNDDNEGLSFDDDIIDLLLDESNPGHVFISSGGDEELNHLGDSERARELSDTSNQGNHDTPQSCPSVESLLNYENQVNDALMDEFIDWDGVCQQANNNDFWNQKEGPDSVVSWLLDGNDEATIGKSSCENFGEPLDHVEEHALVAWLLS